VKARLTRLSHATSSAISGPTSAKAALPSDLAPSFRRRIASVIAAASACAGSALPAGRSGRYGRSASIPSRISITRR
jgi:hypothetical protein